jgi:hypothetical protein
MVYRLDVRAARSRARVVAAVGTAQALSPAVLVVVLVDKLGYVAPALALGGGAALLALALLRGALEYARVASRLTRLRVETDDAVLRIVSAGGDVALAWTEIARASEVPGRLGGLRLETADGRFDLPRGGDGFGELRARVAAHVPVTQPPRRARLARVALGVAVVLSMLLIPLLLDDVIGRSRLAAIAIVGAAWVALLVIRRR